MVEGFGSKDDSGRGGAGRATSIGGRGDPEASLQALQRFRMVGFPVWGGGRPLRERVEGPDPLASRRAIQPIFAAVSVPHGR